MLTKCGVSLIKPLHLWYTKVDWQSGEAFSSKNLLENSSQASRMSFVWFILLYFSCSKLHIIWPLPELSHLGYLKKVGKDVLKTRLVSMYCCSHAFVFTSGSQISISVSLAIDYWIVRHECNAGHIFYANAWDLSLEVICCFYLFGEGNYRLIFENILLPLFLVS